MADLLILGAGQFGLMVKEIAEGSGIYGRISFLDDCNDIAIGKLCEYESFAGEYDCAIVAIGNPGVRGSYLEKLRLAGYGIATVISPDAFVSPSAAVGMGSIIEPLATVQTGSAVGAGCIISSGAVLRHNSAVGDLCHVDCNSVVVSGGCVPPRTKVEIGSIFRNEN